jgi:hypothetical protein
MKTFIDFLESLGRDSRVRHAPPEQVETLLARADVEPALCNALLRADIQELQALLGAQPNICCVVHAPGDKDEPPDDEEEAEEEEQDDDDAKVRLI